jgi:hypothetical protein
MPCVASVVRTWFWVAMPSSNVSDTTVSAARAFEAAPSTTPSATMITQNPRPSRCDMPIRLMAKIQISLRIAGNVSAGAEDIT